jgi:hypothetical protein
VQDVSTHLYCTCPDRDEAVEEPRVYVVGRDDIKYRTYVFNCGVCGQSQAIVSETPYRDEIAQECLCGTMLVLPVEALR